MNDVNALFDALPDPIFLVDPDGTLVAINARANQEVGRPGDQLIGRCLWDLYPPNSANHLQMVVNQTIKSRISARFVESAGKKWNEVTLLPIVQPGGALQIAICLHEITRQIVAEEKTKRMALQLINLEESERRRISQDLHDESGQSIMALMMQLKTIEGELAAGRNDVQPQVKEAIRSVAEIMKQVRQVFYQLHPPSLDTLPLNEALEAFCQTFARQTGLHVDFWSAPEVPPIPDPQAITLYRLVQEGLANAVKHAHATSVWVNLESTEGEVSLSIEDDGQGFDPQQNGRNMGLSGIQYRFQTLNGTFDLESAPGKGTRMFGSLPLDSKN